MERDDQRSAKTMIHLQLLFTASICWFAWIPAAVLQNLARGDRGHVSVLPIFPIFPLAAWGLGFALESAGARAAVTVLTGAHLILLICFLASIVKSKRTLAENGRMPRAALSFRLVEWAAYVGAIACFVGLGMAIASN